MPIIPLASNPVKIGIANRRQARRRFVLFFHVEVAVRFLRIAAATGSLVATLMSTCCARIPEFPFGSGADIVPPSIVRVAFIAPSLLRVEFDEPVSVVPRSVSYSAAVVPAAEAVLAGERAVDFAFLEPPSPTVEHSVEAQVTDNASNHLRFAARFYGLNSLLPAMVINEFTTRGSATHPDLVEILILSDGNMAGACLFEGTSGDWSQRIVFPSIDVEAGQFVVVHFRPEGVPEEVNETVRRDHSGGIDATDSAWDLWVADGSGLSGNNGVISLCENPLGGVIDAVVYSNRSSDSDDRYRGFGSAATVSRVDEIARDGQWIGSGEQIAPEDAINPETSTSTRSMARSSDPVDTNRSSDWHVTPTRGLSPGAPNTDESYEAP